MNIFYLSNNHTVCASYHCDKHVVKMIIEYAQLLSTAHRVLDGVQTVGRSKTGRKATRYILNDNRESEIYTATHINHPSAVWVRQSESHYRWLFGLWVELMDEYTRRYGKIHACARLISGLNKAPINIEYGNGFTEPPPAMPDHCKIPGDVIGSYRNYYVKEKSRFATWKTKQPEWFVKGIEENANV